ncbi:MAG TPA: M15 family metallopeptidase [Pseudonocardiaceae bacterium]
MQLRFQHLPCLLVGALLLAGPLACDWIPGQAPVAAVPAQTPTPTSPTPSTAQEPSTASPALPVWVVGARSLPRRPDGYGVVLSTPEELVDRQLPTLDRLPPPASGAYESTINPVPPQILARSTWKPVCPVRRDQLRYLTMSFHGFDGRLHTGEMLVHADVAKTVVGVFSQLFDAGFPIEEMRVTAPSELDLPPSGDGNNTNGFVCRQTQGQTRWSAHASGLAIDLNPFNNPYVRGDLVVPELASAYLNRDRVRPGMVVAGGPAVTAFEAAGWTWGGRWSAPVDFMHFSATGH